MEVLKSYFLNVHPVPDPILEEYVAIWKPYDVPKKHIMTVPGQTERYLYFVLSGVQKSYFLHNNKEHVIAFAYDPSLSGIPESFFTQTPSRYYLEAITNCEFLRISYERHERFMARHRELETLFRKLTEHFLNGVIQRQHEIMALSMEERFRAFVSRSPPPASDNTSKGHCFLPQD